MARNTGTIRQDPKRGTFYVDFRWVEFPTTDEPRRIRLFKLLGGAPINRDRGRAEALLEGIRAELQLGKPPYQVLSRYLEDRAPELAFRGHWQRFLEAKAEDLADGEITKARYGELSAYERRGYLDDLMDLSIHSINARVLDDWKRALQRRKSKRDGQPLARKTVRHVVNDVGTFLRWLHRYGEIDEVPEIPEVRLGQMQQPKVPSEEMLERYLDAIPEEARGIFLIRSRNGLRMPEARALRVADYDFERDTITLRHSKTGELPTLPVDWEVAEWVQKHVDPRGRLLDAPLFLNPSTGEQWTYSSERRVHKKACQAIGTYFNMGHCGRHAFGTHAVARSGDLAAVQKAMRHADTRTTAGYIDREQLDIVHVLRPRGRRR